MKITVLQTFIALVIPILGLVHSATFINGQNVFNVMDHGAKGDGVADDTNAFIETWKATCAAAGDSSTMVVPSGHTFLLLPIVFEGHCKSNKLNLQILGQIVAPELSRWNAKDMSKWLEFHGIKGLSVTGPGALDGRGQSWWNLKCNINPKPGCFREAPPMIKLIGCTDLQLSNLTFTNSPQMHVTIDDGLRINATYLQITSPATSPNTDGIHVEHSQHVEIGYSVIGTGDDCISIGDKTSDVNIHHIECGPGHGISVGSLGGKGEQVSVENIHVSYVNFKASSNGARIKTWQGGEGFVTSVWFENINFTNVMNPVIIDQYYCDFSQVRSCIPQVYII
ncbi:probable polygalacturonase At3g15720 [Typha latifolia]|uniref:probable polygalacturonase At3g15720 n=1 Tax=Typha latifolia TaxID=4733 RepID=UPI003C2B72D8